MKFFLLLLPLFILTNSSRGQGTFRTDTSETVPFKSTHLPTYTLPALLIGYGFSAIDQNMFEAADRGIHHEIIENYPNFSTSVESKLQYAPVAMVYSLNLLGLKSEHNFIDRTGIYLVSTAVASVSVDFLKDKTHRLRPSGANYRSFPSGHSANAFLAAEFMRREYQHTSPWFGYAGYSMAIATGGLRMMNNDHWLSDVVAGAGVGILSAEIGYATYPWLKKKIFNGKEPAFLLLPAVSSHGPGYALVVPLH